MTKEKQYCSARVWSSDHFRDRPCSRYAKVEVDGKHYCRQHDPAATAARRQKREAKWDADAKRREWGWKRQRLCDEAYDLLAEEGHTFDHDAVAKLKQKIQRHEKKRPKDTQ